MKRNRSSTTFTLAAINGLVCGRICVPETPGLRIETLSSGKKRWKFRRRLPDANAVIKMHLGLIVSSIVVADSLAGMLVIRARARCLIFQSAPLF
jgi:hypothetical protein